LPWSFFFQPAHCHDLARPSEELFGKGTDTQGDAFVVNVTRSVAEITDVVPPLGFSSDFHNARSLDRM
jgi:hypothetical protein